MKALVLLLLLIAGAAVIEATPTTTSNKLGCAAAPDGSYIITVNGEQWLRSGPTAINAAGKWCASNGTAACLQGVGVPGVFSGADQLGAFNATQMTWNITNVPGATMVTTIKYYSSWQVCSFTQAFPQGVPATSVWNTDAVLSAFPTFRVEGEKGALGYAAWWGQFLGGLHTGLWWNETALIPTGKHAGPLAIFNQKADATLILAPGSEFMAASLNTANDAESSFVQYGILGGVMEIPAGWAMDTLVSLGNGPNAAMEKWGDFLLTKFGKSRDGPSRDYTTRNLMYNTDHGAYYYYQTEPNKNYMETLLDVYNYAQVNSIPYKGVLLDSWWYWKGDNFGVKNWTAMPSIFPGGNAGLLSFTQQTGWHVIGHNRYWADNNDYAKQNGGDYNFIIERDKQLAIPMDETFWEFLMSSSAKWGLSVYEQDWLFNEFDWMNITQSNITVPRTWLLQMGAGAARAGITIQYCMPYPRHAMQSVEIAAVTQIRASPDYVPNESVQWTIGASSMLAHALALAPFKDSFWTTTIQPNNPYASTEPTPPLQACIATLSTGPVTPSDRINYTNIPLVMRSCMSNGVLLQPDRPATAVDGMFISGAWGEGGPLGELYSTYSSVGELKWDHFFAAEMLEPFMVDLSMSVTPTVNKLVYSIPTWSFNASLPNLNIQRFYAGDSFQISKCGTADFQLFHAAPVLQNGWTVLGELDKWVPVSAARFSSISAGNAQITINIRGEPGEIVHVTFANLSTVVQQDVVITAAGTATYTIEALPNA